VLCALDARTGEPRWEKHFNGATSASAPAKPGLPLTPSASGQLAWYGGRLWWHVGDSGILVADPATGDVRPAADSEQLRKKGGGTWYGSRGQDIGILPGGWVVLGGRQFNLPLGDVQPRNSSCFLRADPEGAPLDVNGLPTAIVLNDSHEFDAIPVWDADETLLFGKPPGWKIDQIPPILCRGLAEALTTKASVRPEGAWNSGVKLAAKLALAPDQQRAVFPEGMKFRSLHSPILAANAVVFLTGDGNRWRVVAVNRADHTLLWDVELPGHPLLNGLALTRAGSVLAPLNDGRLVCAGTEVQVGGHR
jgi:outer membrane protein assembly factor BamB